MSLYRRKPVIIEAVTWNGKYEVPNDWPEWFRNRMAISLIPGDNGVLFISTPHGTVTAAIGDVIIKGTRGEVYPIKADHFAEIYESVPETRLPLDSPNPDTVDKYA
jgi:hypothetical protein